MALESLSETVRIKKDDTAVWPTFTLKEGGAAKDLSSTPTIVLYMRKVGASTNKVDGSACDVVGDGTAGEVTYTPVAGDVDTAGTYRAYFRVTWSDSTTSRFPNQGNPGTDNDYFRVEISENFE